MDISGLTRVPQTSDEKVTSPTVRRGKDHLDVDERGLTAQEEASIMQRLCHRDN